MNNIERPIVAKFGGSSMVDADSIRRVADIVNSDPARRIIVVSAPGTNSRYSRKITRLLEIASIFEGHKDYDEGESRAALKEFSERFSQIGRDLGCSLVDYWIQEARQGIFPGNDEWSMSRGEWLMARFFASHLGATFIDAEEIVRLSGRRVDPRSYELIRERLAQESGICVIPGFYGLDYYKQVKTFPKGGSDITGAVMARGVNARLYENWTDVDGVLSANPRIIDKPRIIRCMTYEEMRELGALVLQRDAILPLVEAHIAINLRNTFNPDDPGTMINSEREVARDEHVVAIGNDGPFVSFNIQKYGMNDEIGIGRKILEPFYMFNVSYEHNPSGRDYSSVIVRQDQLDGLEPDIVDQLTKEVKPDGISVRRDLGLLSLVGLGIRNHTTEVIKTLLSALSDASISVRAINFATSGISIVIATDFSRLEDAVRASHAVFIEKAQI